MVAQTSVVNEVNAEIVVRLVTDGGGEQRVEGTVSDNAGEHGFVGWMALLDLLESLVEGRGR